MGNNVYKDLHELNHVDSSLSSVDNDFEYPEDSSEIFGSGASDYQQSIQMFIVLSAVIGCLIILIVGVIVSCIDCRSDEDDEDPKPVKWGRWIVSGLILVPIILSIVYAFELNSSIEDVQDLMNESYTPFQEFIDSANDIQVTLQTGVDQCDDIIEESDYSQIDDAVAAIQGYLQTSIDLMEDFLGDADAISWDESGDALDPAREAILYICLGVTAFLLVMVIVSLLTGACSNACKCITSILIIFCMLIVWIFGSLQFGISVEVADICADPESATIQAVSSGADTIGDEYNDTIAILEYYVYCDDEHNDNPLTQAVNDTRNQLFQIDEEMRYLVNISILLNESVSEINALYETYDTALDQTLALADTLDCDGLNSYYNKILDEFCFDLLDAWYALYVTQWVTVGLLLLRMCFICKTNSWAD